MPRQCSAWLLDLGEGQHAAVGYQHMLEFVTTTPVFEIPHAPRHCVGVMLCRQNIVPIIDINRLIGVTHTSAPEHMRVGIMAYQNAPGEPLRYGGLLLESEPREVAVSDDMVRPLPAHPTGWRSISLSCFSLEGRAVPILHVAKLFEESFHREAARETFAVGQSGDSGSPETSLATDQATPASLTTVGAEVDELSAQGAAAEVDPAPVTAASEEAVPPGSPTADHSMQSEMAVDRSTSEALAPEAESSNAPWKETSSELTTAESTGQPEPDPHRFETGREPVVPGGGASADQPNEAPAPPGESTSSVNLVATGGDDDEPPVEVAGGSEDQTAASPATDKSRETADTERPTWLPDRRERTRGS